MIARVVRVLDGDTLDVVALEDWLGADAGEVTRVRIAGIDTPELPTRPGRRARRRLARYCPPGATVIVTPADPAVDRYGRTLAYVSVMVGARLIEDGHARRWTP